MKLNLQVLLNSIQTIINKLLKKETIYLRIDLHPKKEKLRSLYYHPLPCLQQIDRLDTYQIEK